MIEYIDNPDLPDAVRIKALRDLHTELRTPPASLVEQKPKGGTMLSFVGHAAVTEMLLRHDPLWSWVPYAVSPLSGEPLMDRDSNGRPAGMWIKLTIFDHSRVGYGSVEVNERKQDGDLIKEIIGDGIRNAAMRFGIALNLWSKSDLESAAQPPSAADLVMEQATKWTKPQRDKIKQVLKAQGIIDDNATTFELFAEQVSKHESIAKDVKAWALAKEETEKKIIKDLEEIATNE